MLRLVGGQAETLLDEALPIEARELPEELAKLDALLADPALLEPVERARERESRCHGRPTIPICVATSPAARRASTDATRPVPDPDG